MAMSLDAAAEVFREAMRETVKRYALWYLIEGVLLVVAGFLAIIFPIVASATVVILLGWLLIISGALQGLSLIGARHVPHFWLQLISVCLAILVGFLFLRDPAQGMLTIALLLIVFFMAQLGLGAGKRAGRHSSVTDPVGHPASDGRMADRVPARHQPDQRRRGDRLPRLAGAD
jgi:hypothetical protein